jgi:maleylpyruvate isomerase
VGRAQVRQIAEIFNSGIQPLQNTSVQLFVKEALKADDNAWILHWVPRGLEAAEALVRQTAGRFAFGDAPTMADCCIVPQMYFCRRFGIDLAPYPTLLAVERACEPLDAFAQAHATRQVDAEV